MAFRPLSSQALLSPMQMSKTPLFPPTEDGESSSQHDLSAAEQTEQMEQAETDDQNLELNHDDDCRASGENFDADLEDENADSIEEVESVELKH